MVFYVECMFYVVQPLESTSRGKDVRDTLAAEWKSFEKLVEFGSDEQNRAAAAAEQDRVSVLSSWDHLKKPAITSDGQTNQPFASRSEVRQKRLFREAQSDSDGNNSSDSEDESRTVLPAVGVNSGSDNKIDRHSTSSDSSRAEKNKPRTKSSSSDSDASSDDGKQRKLPAGKYSSMCRK